MTSTPVSLSVLNGMLGPQFIGLIVASILYGVSCLQAYYYFSIQNDTWHLKLLVSSVIVFDTIHQILITHTVYTYAITNWGNPPEVGLLVWSLLLEVIFTGLTTLLVQSFLTLRVWRLSNKKIILTTVVALLVAAEFICSIVYTVQSLDYKTFKQLKEIEGLSLSVNVFAAAADILIAGTLCTILHRSRTGFHRSDSMINQLIVFTVNTGFLTSLCALASLISILVSGKTLIYFGFYFCIGRLYANSLFATLNARQLIKSAGGEGISCSEQPSVSLREYSKRGTMPSQIGTNISIRIDTTKDFDSASDQDREQDLEKGKTSSSQLGITA